MRVAAAVSLAIIFHLTIVTEALAFRSSWGVIEAYSLTADLVVLACALLLAAVVLVVRALRRTPARVGYTH